MAPNTCPDFNVRVPSFGTENPRCGTTQTAPSARERLAGAAAAARAQPGLPQRRERPGTAFLVGLTREEGAAPADASTAGRGSSSPLPRRRGLSSSLSRNPAAIPGTHPGEPTAAPSAPERLTAARAHSAPHLPAARLPRACHSAQGPPGAGARARGGGARPLQARGGRARAVALSRGSGASARRASGEPLRQARWPSGKTPCRIESRSNPVASYS
ncbi:uncharacterized protein VSU04_010919 isoform 1-T1 [Chlamydotis macqueenii]